MMHSTLYLWLYGIREWRGGCKLKPAGNIATLLNTYLFLNWDIEKECFNDTLSTFLNVNLIDTFF